MKPAHFHTVKLAYAGVYLFPFFDPKHRLWVLVTVVLGLNIFDKIDKTCKETGKLITIA